MTHSPPLLIPNGRRPKSSWLVPVVLGLARYRYLVLLVMAGITAASVLLALRLDPEFDVKDFFDSNSDFVVSLDKLDEHIAERSGEPGIIYIKGDLTDLQALAAMQQFVGKLAQNPYVGRDGDGVLSLQDNVFSMLKRVMGSAYARGQVTQASGLEITDNNGDGIPDSKEQIKATYDYIIQNGVPLDESTLVFDIGQVREGLFHDPSGGEDNVTVLVVGIPDSREQTTVKAAREALTEDLEVLLQNPLITRVGVTGSPFIREGQLGATTSSLQKSLPIAAAAALVLLLLTMRSLRYAVVTIIPVGLVVAWLYALMYLIGFNLNLVTATIGAISIGVGIDYSIHMTERFLGGTAQSGDQDAGFTAGGERDWSRSGGISRVQYRGLHHPGLRADAHVLVLRVLDGYNDLPGAGRLPGGPSLPVATSDSREGGPGSACSCHSLGGLATRVRGRGFALNSTKYRKNE